MNKPFKEIQTPAELAQYFNLPYRTFNYYLFAVNSSKHYKTFYIKKRNGNFREINSPKKYLKEMQKKIQIELEAIYVSKKNVHGYVSGRGIKTNATKHVRKEWVAKIDLKDFYPSINFGRVYGMFKAPPFNFSDKVAQCLAIICTNENQLPQGSSASPIISNIICAQLDNQLIKLAHEFNCSTSRYADDIVFSKNSLTFPSEIVVKIGEKFQIGKKLEDLIIKNGFLCNHEKTQLINKKSRQVVTGIVVNKKLNITKEYVRQLKGLLHAWEKYGKYSTREFFFQKHYKRNTFGINEQSFEDIVAGKIRYIGHIKGYKNKVFLDLAERFSELSERLSIDKNRSYQEEKLKIKILFEGTTDTEHIKTALNIFHQKKEYTHLKIDFIESITCGGYKEVVNKINALKLSPQSTLTIALFDRDIKNDIKKDMGLLTDPYAQVTNGLYTLLMPEPKLDRPVSEKDVCIEQYYKNIDFYRTKDNRRFYLKNEFDENGIHRTDPTINHAYPQKESFLISEHIFQNGNSIALSKANFAEEIKANKNIVNFSNFALLFDQINNIQSHFLKRKKKHPQSMPVPQ